jgi:hypothetical protein
MVNDLPGDCVAEGGRSTAPVSVIIPTRNRPHLVVRAVRSALGQTLAPCEVIVVIDGPDPATAEALEGIADSRVRVLPLTMNGGPGRARNKGIAASQGEWIAFLDDDDEWLPHKLEAQWAHVGSGRTHDTVVTAVAELRTDDGTYRWPLRALSPGESIAEYLFVRRQPGEGYVALPTVLLPRRLAIECPFPEHLTTHEDWDWLLDLELAGAHFHVELQPLVIVNDARVRQSVSRGSAWNDSLGWILQRKTDVSPVAFSSFCLTEVARSMKRDGSCRLMAGLLMIATSGKVEPWTLLRFIAIALLPSGVRARAGKRLKFFGHSRHGRPSARPPRE